MNSGLVPLRWIKARHRNWALDRQYQADVLIAINVFFGILFSALTLLPGVFRLGL